MKRMNCFIYGVVLAWLSLGSCSDKEDGLDSSVMLDIYGRQYSLSEGVIWENNPNVTVATVPYVFEDTYVNADGVEVTDQVAGYTAGAVSNTTGNFMLSLYEDGLSYNDALQVAAGKAACICFHLSSEEADQLKMGKYVYGKEKVANHFIAYSSSDYDTEKSNIPAEITEGEVTVAGANGNYSVKFNCKTSFGGEVKGEYTGILHKCRVAQQPSAYYESLTLAGLMDTVVTTETWFGGEPEISTSLDINNGAAFLSTGSGTCKYARDGGKDLVDIALVWDKTKESFYFESPIRMRSLLGHNSTYNFPCHTIYMKAPDSFTDADFENLEKNEFSFEIREEKVEFPTGDFKPGYVFFQTGKGIRGVIRVKGFAPLGSKTESQWGGWVIVDSQVNPVLYIDVKCPASFLDPKIR